MIPQKFIQEVQSRTDIVELISSYIPLKKTGRNFKALCPFHNEKTPSFIVSPQKQIFHCFGCGEGGGVVQFLMLYEKVNFVEAIETLARRLGLEVPYQRISTQERIKSVLYDVVSQASTFFFENLIRSNEAEQARRYLEARGISREVITHFKIGYAPRGVSIIEVMRKKDFNLEILEKASLIIPKKDGGYIDLFRERIVFPIFDIRGRVVGFGARILQDRKDSPKYINSLENPLYSKREQLYGLNFSKDEILAKDSVIVVEGYFDMITPYVRGVRNIVASLGTALTEEQIRIIKRYTKNIVLVFDSDKAGELATLRALDLLLENNLDIGIVELSSGFDPDLIVRKKGKEYFCNLLERKLDFFDYKIKILKNIYDLESITGKSSIAEEMLSTIDKIPSEVKKYEYIKKLSSFLEVKEEFLLLELRKQARPRLKQARQNFSVTLKEPPPITEKLLIQFMINNKKAMDLIKKRLRPDDFSHPLTKKAASLLFEKFVENKEWSPEKILGFLEEREVARFISELAMDEGVSLNKNLLRDCILKLKRRRLDILKGTLKAKLKQAEAAKDTQRVKELILKYKEVNSEVKNYG
jgi:DNA primase